MSDGLQEVTQKVLSEVIWGEVAGPPELVTSAQLASRLAQLAMWDLRARMLLRQMLDAADTVEWVKQRDASRMPGILAELFEKLFQTSELKSFMASFNQLLHDRVAWTGSNAGMSAAVVLWDAGAVDPYLFKLLCKSSPKIRLIREACRAILGTTEGMEEEAP